jgi:hypothetical protein
MHETITKHNIDGEFVESHGREVMDIVNPTIGKIIAHATLADEEDTRRAIGAGKTAFVSFGRSTMERGFKYSGAGVNMANMESRRFSKPEPSSNDRSLLGIEDSKTIDTRS